MIRITRLNDSNLVINALLIERIESTPDTVIKLTTGSQYVVKESSDEIQARAIEFLRSLRGDSNSAPLAQISRVIR